MYTGNLTLISILVQVMSHSDDLLWFGTSKAIITKYIDLLRKKVPMTPTTWSPVIFRGIELLYHQMGITLHQSGFIKEFPKKFNLENRKTPDVPGRDAEQTFQPAAVYQSRRLSKNLWYDKVVFNGLPCVHHHVLMSLIGLQDTCRIPNLIISSNKKTVYYIW